MNQLLIEKIEGGKRFILQQKKTSVWVKLVLALVTIGTISIPILVLLSDGMTKGVILAAMICAVLAIYFLRLFLWNSFGKEVFEIQKDRVRHYTDYHFFKDELFSIDDLTDIAFYKEREAVPIEVATEKTLPDIQLNKDTEAFVFIITQKNRERTRSNIKLSRDKVETMLAALKN